MSTQVDFVRSVCPGDDSQAPPCVKVAPAFAYNASIEYVRALVADGSATILLLSADANDQNPSCVFNDNKVQNGVGCKMSFGPYPGGPPGGNSFVGPTEGAPLVSLDENGRARMRQWAATDGATLVLDAVPATDGESGRAAELAEVVALLKSQGS